MTECIRKLLGLGSDSVRSLPANFESLREIYGDSVSPLGELLEMKNGCYLFENALHIFSDIGTKNERGLVEWNSNELWRQDYGSAIDDIFFFAEDTFGIQFCFVNKLIATFDPETGSLTEMARDLEAWAAEILDNYNIWTGYQIAHEWQCANGMIPVGSRLLPIIPFVLGGELVASNMHAIEAVKGMRYRASIASQIRDLPDGTSVKLQVIE